MFGNFTRTVQQLTPFCIVDMFIDQFLDALTLLLNGGCLGIRRALLSRDFEAPLESTKCVRRESFVG
jgi:hypothetical protein